MFVSYVIACTQTTTVAVGDPPLERLIPRQAPVRRPHEFQAPCTPPKGVE